MGKLSPEERPRVGQLVNEAREELEALLATRQEELTAAELAQRGWQRKKLMLPCRDEHVRSDICTR